VSVLLWCVVMTKKKKKKRYIKQRSKSRAHFDELKLVVDAASVPIIGNGDVLRKADIARIKDETGSYFSFFYWKRIRFAKMCEKIEEIFHHLNGGGF